MTKSKKNQDKYLKLSVSSVDTFQTCKAKWYYRYIEKLPSPGNYYSTTGKFIHKILEIFLRRYKKTKDLRDAGNVAFWLAQKDKEISPDLTPKIKAEGKAWLKEKVKQLESDAELIPTPVGIEHPFTFKIEEDKILIRGIIDRIDDIDEETIEIVDYKTSSRPEYLKPFQLATYALAVEPKHPGKEIKASYELIRHNFTKKSFDITDKLKQEAINNFKKTGKQIRKLQEDSPDSPWEASPSKLCSFCPYRTRCEKDRDASPWDIM